MEVPVKTVIHGDGYKARFYEHHAVRLMGILERFMSFQGLSQCSMKKEIEPGVWVEAKKIFGLRTAHIHVGGNVGRHKKIIRECLCNCNFTLGFISEIVTEKLDDEFQLYNVAVCFGGTRFLLLDNILASDFTEYVEGQKVLLVPYNDMEYTCCTNVTTATGCRPIWANETPDKASWRSTLRIVPWCAYTIPRWINTKEV